MAFCEKFRLQSVLLRVDINFAYWQKCDGAVAGPLPSTLTGAGLPVPTPDGRSPGRERVVVPPNARSRPSMPLLWGTSRQVVGFSGAGLSCCDLTNPSLTRHSSGTWPRHGHPPSSPRYSTVLSRPFLRNACA